MGAKAKTVVFSYSRTSTGKFDISSPKRYHTIVHELFFKILFHESTRKSCGIELEGNVVIVDDAE